MIHENEASFVVLKACEGGEPEDENWTRVVAVECSEQAARRHLPDGLVEWPTDPASVLALDQEMEVNSIIVFRIERWVSTHHELVCKETRQDKLDGILSR
jgi:hypothetical protein